MYFKLEMKIGCIKNHMEKALYVRKIGGKICQDHSGIDMSRDIEERLALFGVDIGESYLQPYCT